MSTLCRYDFWNSDLFVLLWLNAERQWMYVYDACWFYVCCSDYVAVCGKVCCVLALECCEVWSCRCSCMGSMSVSSCRCCMFVSCVHIVSVLNAAFCMTCSLLILDDDARDHYMEEAYSRAGLMTAL